MLRLLRMARMTRVATAVPELAVLVKGMATAIRSVITILTMLFLIIYGISIIMYDLMEYSREQSHSDQPSFGAQHFPSVQAGMYSLFMQVVCGFDADFISGAWSAGGII